MFTILAPTAQYIKVATGCSPAGTRRYVIATVAIATTAFDLHHMPDEIRPFIVMPRHVIREYF